MNFEQIVKSNQEQAVASWIDYLNQLRIDYILALLKQQKDAIGIRANNSNIERC